MVTAHHPDLDQALADLGPQLTSLIWGKFVAAQEGEVPPAKLVPVRPFYDWPELDPWFNRSDRPTLGFGPIGAG